VKLALTVSLALVACAVDRPEPTVDDEDATTNAPGPQRRQLVSGTGLLVLEVTDDDYAIYQDGTHVRAVSLHGGAPQSVGESPAGNTAFVYRVGTVAFVWTNPNRALANFGVSPLVVWSASTGPHLASASSAVGTLATAASRHGNHVIFPGNSQPDGSKGDLVYASTDLSHQTTLVANAQFGFATGPCNPLATFIERDPIALYCTSDPTTAMLSRWTAGVRRDLTSAFAPPQLAVDPERDRIMTLAAGSRNPLLVDHAGAVTTLAAVSGTLVNFGPDGSIYFASRAMPPAPASLLRFRHTATKPLGAIQAIIAFTFGSRSFSEPITSPDGRSFLVQSMLDSTTGYGNIVRLDARGTAPPITIDARLTDTQSGPGFTSTSRFALYALGDPTLTTFTGPMFAADRDGAPRQFSDNLGWEYLPSIGNTIVYSDNTMPDAMNPALNTADLKLVDLERTTLAPRLIATQANATFFVTQRKTGVVFTTDRGDAPGLYVDRAF
jgi:hypothetical protein